MRIVLQRVEKGTVLVGAEVAGRIGPGLVLLVGIEDGDGAAEVGKAAQKLHHLRIFSDTEGRMNLAAHQVGGEFLVVSQFTLAGSLAKGRRPSFERAAPPAEAEPLVRMLAEELRRRGNRVQEGVFGADMHVELVNAGPVTFVLDVHAEPAPS